ncbi:hypothetical protein [Streptomyces pratensis]|uniref:hypothetical protein n=1 Tax=Streptomyces pratensis TaxID=1169025 RepID=UPI0030179E61
MAKPYFQVNVPTTHRAQPGRRGLHVFTGPADTGREAVRHARAACEASLAAQAAGAPAPRRYAEGWGARGVRTEWVFDWAAATALPWEGDGLFGNRSVLAHGPSRP